MDQFNGKPGVLLLTPREVAEALRISERSLWTITRRGEIASIRVGRLVRYSPADVQSWIDARRRTAAAPAEPADLEGQPRQA
jgi:excisionase family DNA binding protein